MSATETINTEPLPTVEAAEPVPVRTIGWPWFTLLFIVLLGIVFVYEIGLNDGTGTTPSTQTLVVMGGLFRPLVLAGEWWRLITGPLLHANPSHIFFNCLALLLIGIRLEPPVGWRWFSAIFAVSALCGSVASLLINAPTIVGVGASGGIVGLFASALIVVARIPNLKERVRLARVAAGSLLPTLVPFFSSVSTDIAHVDYGAHFGGAIGGVLMGRAVLRLWPKHSARPTKASWGAVAVGAFFAVAAGALLPINNTFQQTAVLVPDWPTDEGQLRESYKSFATKYPHDPRTRFTNAIFLLQEQRLGAAETELKAALAETDILQHQFKPAFEDIIRSYLAIVLVAERKTDEAKIVMRSSCGHAGIPDQLQPQLDDAKLCV